MDNKRTGLIPGKRYKIQLDDCCIQGHVTGTFLGWEFPDSAPDEGPGYARFDFGELGPDWGAWYPEEIVEAQND